MPRQRLDVVILFFLTKSRMKDLLLRFSIREALERRIGMFRTRNVEGALEKLFHAALCF